MRLKHYLLFATAAVAASSLSSCTQDEYFISAQEEYTRNFIKNFGLIDPKQDWNLAQNSAVTVMVGDTPSQVKAYMKVDGTYYLVADLEKVSGTVNVPFDMPEGTKDIMVKINGKRYYTAPGGTVDPNKASRALKNEGENTFAGVTVLVEENPHGRVLTLDSETIDEAIDFLPENSDGITSWSESNMDKVTDNFVLTGKEFYLFPEYWNTSANSDNIIGIYWEVEPNTEGATHILHYPAGKTQWDWPTPEPEVDCWIMQVPFFQNPADFFMPYKKDYDGNIVQSPTGGNSAYVYGAEYYESKAVHVVLDREMTFGFYIQQGSYLMFSESRLNEYYKKLNADGEEEYRQVSYVATFLNGTDTEGNDKRHLCFEDWYGDNWDLNDMIFRVYGFDNIADGSMETGKVEDIDNPDPDPNPDPKPDPDPDPEPTPDDEVDEPFQWLLAVEDLGSTDDFDFNDIIVGISATTVDVLPEGATAVGNALNGQYKKVVFKAMASGGTLAAYLFYGEDPDPLYPDGKSVADAEWHRWFGNGYDSSKMINTGYGTDGVEGHSCTRYYGTKDNNSFIFNLSDLTGGIDAKGTGFKVGIDNTSNTVSSNISQNTFNEDEKYFVEPASAGEAPQMFLIPDNGAKGKWEWPRERQTILGSYSQFKAWVSQPDIKWYMDDKAYNVCRY